MSAQASGASSALPSVMELVKEETFRARQFTSGKARVIFVFDGNRRCGEPEFRGCFRADRRHRWAFLPAARVWFNVQVLPGVTLENLLAIGILRMEPQEDSYLPPAVADGFCRLDGLIAAVEQGARKLENGRWVVPHGTPGCDPVCDFLLERTGAARQREEQIREDGRKRKEAREAQAEEIASAVTAFVEKSLDPRLERVYVGMDAPWSSEEDALLERVVRGRCVQFEQERRDEGAVNLEFWERRWLKDMRELSRATVHDFRRPDEVRRRVGLRRLAAV